MQKVKGSNVFEAAISKASQDFFNALEAAEGPELWPRWMDIATAANYIAKSDSCVRNWIREGVIPTVTLTTLQHRKKQPVFIDRYALDRLFAVNN